MAKSIRSKRKRMLRNIKRERYAKKELEKLKQVVALAEKDKDADMKDLYTVTDPLGSTNKSADEPSGSGSMEVDTKNRDPKTLRDEDGHYPVWMNSRRIKRHKKRLQSMAKKKEKTQKAKKKR
uniref:18 kDa learning-associated protein of slug-like isoform X1 n=1 Tax=Crassostrea virginica TaxID=6565 RepID=A0A8B8BAA7_CRAVI|nr:18 kDa learning-associated protein of slug-like isoform X1 [Crassostrea virginica]XP_022300106.1 18 kDa learning-associated protein of slug-like isoform X1 [Crassostrea virginica]XP_022300107.1 18 kDa learning-associated protein of slug-like isoform X1 [Crassostrea virginica]XP_022300108.1 18 kDa learning-associated protein of slug-like isoform X1 [Crassostrea virginica]